MKVRIFKCSDPSYWYASRHVGEKFDVIGEKDDFYQVKGLDNMTCFIEKKDCDVVSGEGMDFLKHRMTEEKMDEVYFYGPAFESKDKAIKMSIDTAREMYKDSTISTKNWLLENFTQEELEPKKGFTWEESFDRKGYYIDNASSIINLEHVCSDDVSFDGNKNVFKTHEQAESALAFAQLSHIVARYNEGKKPGYVAWAVMCNNLREGCLLVDSIAFNNILPHIVFLTKEDAEMSLEMNRELWEQYWLIKK